MSDPSTKCSQMTLTGSSNVTSSQELGSGPSAPAVLDGPMTDLFGLVHAPAVHSAEPESKRASKTRATFGRNGFGSSASAGLACCLANNLRMRTTGSILYRLIWKASVTPSGRLIYRLRASEARTEGSDLGSWPTPTTPSGGQSVPLGTTASGRRPDGSKATVTLEMVARVSAWPTPTASDFKGSGPTVIRKDGKDRTFDRLDYSTEQGLIGSSEQTAGGARLNPALARSLMRIPPVWDSCSVTATASTLKSSRT